MEPRIFTGIFRGQVVERVATLDGVGRLKTTLGDGRRAGLDIRPNSPSPFR